MAKLKNYDDLDLGQMFGTCRYCKQVHQISEKEFDEYTKNPTKGDANPQDIKDWLAMLQCDCTDARACQHVEEVKEETISNIKVLFEADHEEAARVLESAAGLMAQGKISKLSMQISSKTKATMSRTSKGDIQLKRTVTNTDTLES